MSVKSPFCHKIPGWQQNPSFVGRIYFLSEQSIFFSRISKLFLVETPSLSNFYIFLWLINSSPLQTASSWQMCKTNTSFLMANPRFFGQGHRSVPWSYRHLRLRDTSLQQRAASPGASHVGAVIREGRKRRKRRNLGGIRPSFHSGGIIKWYIYIYIWGTTGNMVNYGIVYDNMVTKGSLGGETSVLRTFRMSGK